MQRFGGVTLDVQSAALRRPFRSEGANNDVSARFDRFSYAFDVGGAISGHSQEVKHCPIMLNVIGIQRKAQPCNIRYNPFDIVRQLAKPRFRDFQRGRGYIQNR